MVSGTFGRRGFDVDGTLETATAAVKAGGTSKWLPTSTIPLRSKKSTSRACTGSLGFYVIVDHMQEPQVANHVSCDLTVLHPLYHPISVLPFSSPPSLCWKRDRATVLQIYRFGSGVVLAIHMLLLCRACGALESIYVAR